MIHEGRSQERLDANTGHLEAPRSHILSQVSRVCEALGVNTVQAAGLA